MQYNVAQLLKEPIGSTRSYQLEEVLSGAGRFADQVNGPVQLLRTHQGILTKAELEVDAVLTCGRCLVEYPLDITIRFEEEFFPIVDINTGAKLSIPGESEGASIDANHNLDLTEVLRQYAITDLPMKPLCRPDCLGLCHLCGANLNQKKCQCGRAEIDPRWRNLAELLQQQQS